MATRPRCVACGLWFCPDVRSVRHQKCCSRRCAKKAKRKRDRKHKKDYRATGLGREQRRRESKKRREKLEWATYMRSWRKADIETRAEQARKQARQYYEKHRARILRKRQEDKATSKMRAISPVEPEIGVFL